MEYEINDGEFREDKPRIVLGVSGCDCRIRGYLLSSLEDLGFATLNGEVLGSFRMVYDPPNEEEALRIRNGIHETMEKYESIWVKMYCILRFYFSSFLPHRNNN